MIFAVATKRRSYKTGESEWFLYKTLTLKWVEIIIANILCEINKEKKVFVRDEVPPKT